MSGVYFIAAGASSKNRSKSLDQGHLRDALADYLDPSTSKLLQEHFDKDEPIFLWGANRIGNLDKLEFGDYVVDVKNQSVVQIFQFKFIFETSDSKLQNWIGWDAEKPTNEQRPYQFVYFLGNPQKTFRSDKDYFQLAFGLEGNRNWLVGQRWFSDEAIKLAMTERNIASFERFLGVESESGAVEDFSAKDTLVEDIDADILAKDGGAETQIPSPLKKLVASLRSLADWLRLTR